MAAASAPAPASAAISFQHISADIRDQIAKFETHVEQYAAAEIASTDSTIIEHQQNLMQFKEMDKNLRDRESAVRKQKEAEEQKLKDAMIRAEAGRNDLIALSTKLASIPAAIESVQQQQTQKQNALNQKQSELESNRHQFGTKLSALMASVALYSERLGLTITTDNRGLGFVYTHIDPNAPQRKFELLLGQDENADMKILSTTPALDTTPLEESVDWGDISTFGYVVQWVRAEFRKLALRPPAPVAAAVMKTPQRAAAKATPSKSAKKAAAAPARDTDGSMSVSAAFATMQLDAKLAAASASTATATATATTATTASAPAPTAAAAAPAVEDISSLIPASNAASGFGAFSYPAPAWQ